MTSTEVETSANNAKTILRHNLNAGIIFERLQTFYEENELFDTVLITGEENKNNRVSIQAHRLVLSSFSEYFLKAFRDAQTVLKKNVLVFQDIEPRTLKSIIDFMYKGSIDLTLDAVEGILRASLMFKMKMLIDECCEFIEENINYSNCLAWFRVARELNLQALSALSKKLVYSHFEQISKEKEMMILSIDELEDLLFNDNPYGNFEEHIFHFVVEWVNYDKTNRDELSMKLLSMVRYQYLTPKFIIENRKSVYNFSSGQELMYDWLEWHWSPENRLSDQQKPNLTQRIIPVDKYKGRFLAVVDISDSDPNEIIIQLYNPTKETWSVQKKIPLFKNKSLISTIVINNSLIVVGGNDSNNLATNSIERLNLNTFEWTEFRPINCVRNLCQLAELNGYIYVFGGFSGRCFVDRMEAYNISTHKVHDVEFPVRRPTYMSKIAVHNGILYIMDIFGGYLQIYDASSNEWTSKVIEKDVLKNFGFVALEGFLYVIGGDNGNYMYKTVKRYDLSSNTWSEVSSLPYPCSHIKTAMFENKIVICAKTITNDDVIAEYDIQTDKWAVLNVLPVKSSYNCSTIRFLTTRIN